MYSTILTIAHDIILIGWALMIILWVVLLIVLLMVALRINKVVGKSMETVSMVSQYIMLPFTYIASFFSWNGDEEKPARKRVATKKK